MPKSHINEYQFDPSAKPADQRTPAEQAYVDMENAQEVEKIMRQYQNDPEKAKRLASMVYGEAARRTTPKQPAEEVRLYSNEELESD